jgi:chromosomal replication initiator protein
MAETGTTREELISRRRAHRILHPTMAAMYVAAELTSASLSEIGRWLGNRDHGTVLSATHRVPQMCQADPAFDALIKKLIAKLQS